MNNLRKFDTFQDYEEAELVKPAVSLIAEDDTVLFDQKDEEEEFGGLTVIYDIEDASNEVTLFNAGGGDSSASGGESESSGGGAMPTSMIIDGNEETPIGTWRFDTTGEHTVQYEFEDNTVPDNFFGFIHEITEVEAGSDIVVVGANSFEECDSITSVTLGNSITSISGSAFAGCASLESIVIPSGVTAIYGSTFNGCASLSSVTIPSGVTRIDAAAFGSCAFDSVVIPSGVTYIGEEACSYCLSLSGVTVLATSVPYLGQVAFQENATGRKIYVPSESVNAYKTNANWSEYASDIEAIQ